MDLGKVPKSHRPHCCEQCNYNTSSKKDFNKHMMTAKHTRNTNDDTLRYVSPEQIPKAHLCECGKQYKHRQGLYAHKQKCTGANPIISNDENHHLQEENSELKTMLQTIIQHTHEKETRTEQSNKEFQTQSTQSNQDFQKMMLEMFKDCIQSISSNSNSKTNIKTQNNTNSNNTNNISYYLNVTCKDAETDLDFLKQWKQNCIELFHDKKELMGERKINYGRLCTELFLKQIKSKPQIERFVQTTNWKDGKTFVNTAEYDEDNQPTGESQFVHHTDGLESVTNIMSCALGKTILDCANQEVKDKYFEENRSINITSRAPTTPDVEHKRYMSAGIMMATSEAFDATCSGASRTQIMKVTTK